MFDERDDMNKINPESEGELETARMYTGYSAPTSSEPETGTPKTKKKKGALKKVGITALCACIAGGLLGGSWMGAKYICNNYLTGGNVEIQSTGDILEKTANAVSLNYADEAEAVANGTIENIVDACLPSVVSITNKGVSEVMTFFGNYQTESISSGSGIIIGENDTELLIVTNYHVVAGTKELTVVFSHDEAALQDGDSDIMNVANVKGYDADKDIAVIAVKLSEISDDTKSQIRIATIGNSDNVKLGSGVVAIGNALGYGQSVTHGIVSAVNREVTMDGVEGGKITNKYIQTDAAINSGNSGGALLNMKGELIGINSAKISSTGVEGMGYAIPITDVEKLIGELMNLKTREVVKEEDRGYLGIYGTDVTSSASSAYGIPVGVFVKETIKNSPAEKSELEAGDVITKVDGVSVSTMSALSARLKYYEKGEKVVLTVKRAENNKYTEKEITVTLGSKEDAGIDD